MVEPEIQCVWNECRRPGRYVVVANEERLVPLCEAHTLEEMSHPQVTILFPISAFPFASQMPKLNPTDITNYLTIHDILKKIDSAQSRYCTPTVAFGMAATTRPAGSSVDLGFVQAVIKQVAEEVNTKPTADWTQATNILKCKNLYAKYIPVLVPPQKSGLVQPQFMQTVSDQCLTISSLLSIITRVQALKGPIGYYENRAISQIFDVVRRLSDVISQYKITFYTYDLTTQMTISALAQRELYGNVESIKAAINVVENVPLRSDFYQEIVQIAVVLYEISFNLSHSEAVSIAFLLKGEAHQRIHELQQATESYINALGSCGASQTIDPRVYTQTRVRLALLYIEAGNYGFAWDNFREAGKLLEDSLDPIELAEAHIGLARLEARSSGFSKANEHISHAESVLSRASIPQRPSLSGQIHLAKGEIRLLLNRYLEAVEYLEVAMSLLTMENTAEEGRSACIGLGTALEALDREMEARDCFRTAIRGMDENHPEYRRLRERLEEAGDHF